MRPQYLEGPYKRRRRRRLDFGDVIIFVGLVVLLGLIFGGLVLAAYALLRLAF